MPYISSDELALLQKMEQQRATLRDAILKVVYSTNLTEEQKLILRSALTKVGVM